MRLATCTWMAALLLTAGGAAAQPASRSADDDPRNQGFSEVKFTERSPFSPIDAQSRRYQIKVEPSERYDLADESFAALVPAEYDPSSKAWGLLVWISSGKSGAPSRGWAPILSKYHLIWIGPNNVDNNRPVGVRMGLALDAASNFQKQYNIDSGRVYAAGVSGGAKVASMLGMIYPEVFSGAVAMAGTTFYRPIPLSNTPGRAWKAEFSPPPTLMLDRAKSLGRFILLVGTNDFNHDSVLDTYRTGFLADGFKHVQCVEIPEMGHGIPEAKWVDDAIAALDAPLAAITKDQFIRAQQLDKAGKITDAIWFYGQVQLHGDEALAAKAEQRLIELKQKTPDSTAAAPVAASPPDRAIPSPAPRPVAPATTKPTSDEAEATGQLSLADNYERNRLYTQAIQRLEKVIKDYPNTKAAATAKMSLERVKAKQRSGG